MKEDKDYITKTPVENINNEMGNNILKEDSENSEPIDEHAIKLDENIITESAKEVVKNNGEIVENLKVAADPQDISQDERKKAVKKLAGAISHALRTRGEINVRAFGNAAISKAVKALAIAKEYIDETHKLQLSYSPAYITTKIGEVTLTGIQFCAFTSEKVEINLDKIKSVLKVQADPKNITSEERRAKVRKLAGAISHAIEENKECLVRCFGSSSIGKACKALAIARGFTATRGPDMYCWNYFIITKMGENERTGICFYTFANS
jgi:stage V sporulation protein S